MPPFGNASAEDGRPRLAAFVVQGDPGGVVVGGQAIALHLRPRTAKSGEEGSCLRHRRAQVVAIRPNGGVHDGRTVER
jgi:hypothetical protein